MKRQLISAFLAGAFLCGLCACGQKAEENTNGADRSLTDNVSEQNASPDSNISTTGAGTDAGTGTDASAGTDAGASTDASAGADAGTGTDASAGADTETTPVAAFPSGDVLTLADIREDMLTTLNITEYMEITDARLLDAYGIQTEDIAQSASFTTLSGTFPHEVILVEAVDDAAAGRIAEKLQARLDEVTNQYKDYDAESYALAQACTVDTDGLVVSLLLSPERETMRQILTDSLA